MATMKKGILVSATEWWRHLRPYGKRAFWKRQREAERREVLRIAALTGRPTDNIPQEPYDAGPGRA